LRVAAATAIGRRRCRARLPPETSPIEGGEEAGMITFYSGTQNASSWAMRAWLALRLANVRFEERVVDIRRPQRFLELAELARFSPSATVPALVIDEAVIFDSLAIMEYACDCADGALLPRDPVLRAEARSLLAWQHAGLSAIAARISFESAFYRFKRSLTAAEIAETRRLFDCLETALVRSGGPFLFGAVSLADCTLVPAVLRLLRHDLPLDAWPRCRQWSTRLLGLGPVAEWLEIADRLPPIWYDEYLVPGVPPDWRPAASAPTVG
jgi:glutathione S-transferase